MKALGTSFLFKKKSDVCLLQKKGGEGGYEKTPLNSEEKLLIASCCFFEDVKVRFYPLPETSLKNQKKMLAHKLSLEPLMDPEGLKYSFKKAPFGVEVHFFEKKRLEPFVESFDFITSPQQALFRFLRDYIRLKDPALVIIPKKQELFCMHYTPSRWMGFANLPQTAEQVEELKKRWNLEVVFYINAGDGENFFRFPDTYGALSPEALSIGSAIELLEPEGIFFHQPLESLEVRNTLLKRSQSICIKFGLILLSGAVFLQQFVHQESGRLEKELKVLESLEDFGQLVPPSPPKVSPLLRDLVSSIEPYDLELVDFQFSVDIFDKKPVYELRFELKGSSQQMEKYAQSVTKIPGSIFAKSQRISASDKDIFVIKVPCRSSV
jgi:hypothetical protein